MVTYGIARPVPGAGGMTDADWREFGSGLGDGIVNSTNPGGSSDFQVALSPGDRTVTLNLGQIRIRGVQFRPTPTNATTTFTLPDIATGQTRSDRIVARYNPAAADTDKITFIQLNGTAVAAGAAVARPAITRIAGGTWDVPLHLFTGGNVTSDTLDHEDHRIFVTSHLHALTPPEPSGARTRRCRRSSSAPSPHRSPRPCHTTGSPASPVAPAPTTSAGHPCTSCPPVRSR
jgi:hypothetical protein